MLLVLDNMEHLLEGAGSIAQVVQAAPDVQVLVTFTASRWRLRVEWVLEIHGLALPALPPPHEGGPL